MSECSSRSTTRHSPCSQVASKVGSDCAAHAFEDFKSLSDASTRIEGVAAAIGYTQPEVAPSLLDRISGLFSHVVRVGKVPADMHIGVDMIPAQAAQKLVNRDAEGLALDIPEGQVDGRHGGPGDALGRKKTTSRKTLPKVFGPERILPDEKRAEMIEAADDGVFAASDAGFTQSDMAVVGFDGEDEQIAGPESDDVGFDGRDFHLT